MSGTNQGLLDYIQELTALSTKYAKKLGCTSPHLNDFLGDILSNTFAETVDHMVACEITRITSLTIENSNSIALNVGNVHASINIKETTWNITSTGGVSINTAKAINAVAANEEVARALLTLSTTMHSEGNTELYEYIKLKTAFLVAVANALPPIMTELNDAVETAKQEAA